MKWSPQQENALKEVKAWLGDPSGKQIFRMLGFAGTGKTTLAKEMAAEVKGMVLYATFTGKAALVLRKKGCENASTIHSLIYTVEIDPQTGLRTFKLNKQSDLADADLLIVDEVSMVGAELANDLLKFKTRILVLGDPAQLPPVKDEGFFINAEPDIMLTEVHRQAQDNPIIRMSMMVRQGERLLPGQYGDCLILRKNERDQDDLGHKVIAADQLLCGLNRSRISYNRRIRAMKSLSGQKQPWHPAVNDRIICLKNNRQKGLFNGGMFDVENVKERSGVLKVVAKSLDEAREPDALSIYEEFFKGEERNLEWQERRKSDEFTFGWAITCHKAQGSEWDDVIIFDESSAFREDKNKWLYTAITRAAQKVTVVI